MNKKLIQISKFKMIPIENVSIFFEIFNFEQTFTAQLKNLNLKFANFNLKFANFNLKFANFN